MKRTLSSILFAALLAFPALAGSASSRTSSRSTSRAFHAKTHSAAGHLSPHSTKCSGCARDAKGRIARSRAAKASFRNANPCPSTGRTGGACPGYVIDHVQALKRGGADSPENMQWQTAAAAKAKDRTE